MIKVILIMDAGFAGSDAHEVYWVTQEQWDIYTGKAKGYDTLADFAWQEAVEHAASYGVYPAEAKPEDYDEDEDYGGDEYSENIEGHFELYDEEKHSGLKAGGGEWDWENADAV